MAGWPAAGSRGCTDLRERAVRYLITVGNKWCLNALSALVLPEADARESRAAVIVAETQSVGAARGDDPSGFADEAATPRVDASAEGRGIKLAHTFHAPIHIDVCAERSHGDSAPGTIRRDRTCSVRADAILGDRGRLANVALGTVEGTAAGNATIDTRSTLTGEARCTVEAFGADIAAGRDSDTVLATEANLDAVVFALIGCALIAAVGGDRTGRSPGRHALLDRVAPRVFATRGDADVPTKQRPRAVVVGIAKVLVRKPFNDAEVIGAAGSPGGARARRATNSWISRSRG